MLYLRYCTILLNALRRGYRTEREQRHVETVAVNTREFDYVGLETMLKNRTCRHQTDLS